MRIGITKQFIISVTVHDTSGTLLLQSEINLTQTMASHFLSGWNSHGHGSYKAPLTPSQPFRLSIHLSIYLSILSCKSL